MATKVLAARLRPTPGNFTNGAVVVNFNPFEIPGVGVDATLDQIRQSGAAGDFLSSPGTVIALRDLIEIGGNSFFAVQELGVNENNMTITWNTFNGQIRELSIMVVGEA